MKKRRTLPLLGSALLLASCGGGGSTPSPVTTTPSSTLYQGVWGWAAADASTGQIVDAGALVLFDEARSEGRKVAFGAYSNDAQTLSGDGLLGPLTAAGELETALAYDFSTTDARLYLLANDDDGGLEATEDGPFFFGAGILIDRTTQQPSQAVYVGLLQLSTEVPEGLSAQSAAKNSARTLAVSAVQLRFRSAAGLQAQSLKAHVLSQAARNIFERR